MIFHFNTTAQKESTESLKSITDTMVFDLDNATTSTNVGITYYDLPMYAITTGGISSFDFWFQFNETKMTYVSTTAIETSLDTYSNFNSTNHNLSNTTSGPNISYEVPGNTTLLILRFQLATTNTVVDTSDFSSVNTLFNGNPCNYEFIYTGNSSGLNELLNQDQTISIYPNPSKGVINVITEENTSIQLLTLDGKELIFQELIPANELQIINLESFEDGIYLLKVGSSHFSRMERVVLVK